MEVLNMELFSILFGLMHLVMVVMAVIMNRAATQNWEQSVNKVRPTRATYEQRMKPMPAASVNETPETALSTTRRAA